MKDEKLIKLLNKLTEKTAESAPPDLADDIKSHIPRRFMPQKVGLGTINIMIDLRINKLTAAAAIIMTMILCASFFGGRGPSGVNLYKDSKLLIKYCLSGDVGGNELLLGKLKYEHLREKGQEVVFYGDYIDPKDSNAILIHQKLPDGKYKVIFADLREIEVTSAELIKLQANMLQTKEK